MARWLLIPALLAGVWQTPAAAEPPLTEAAPAQGGATPAPPAAKPAPAPAPPPSAAEPPAQPPIVSEEPISVLPEPEPAPAPAPAPESGPDPTFADWGAPGSDEVSTEAKIQAAMLLGVGASFDDTIGSVNPLGFGFGVRGSYRFLPDYPELQLGGRFLYFVGGSAQIPNGEISMSSWLLAAEATYVFPVAGLFIEPGLALGLSARSLNGTSPFIDQGGFVPGSDPRTDVGFYVAPGAAVCIPLSLMAPELALWFIGADARLEMVFAEGFSGSLSLMAQGGLRF